MIHIVNAQRKVAVERTRWLEFVARALPLVRKQDVDVTVAFVSDDRMRRLNRDFRGLNRTTDVLSFPAGEDQWSPGNLGDIVISLAQAQRQAAENELSPDVELAQLILHGLLHLCGYDHETDQGEMRRLELRLRTRLGIDA